MRRNVNLWRLFGNLYIALILVYMGLIYYVLMYRNALIVPNKTIWTYLHMAFLHTVLFLLLFSFFQTIISDPGKVPLFWGFFLDDPDHKRRRYCLICHIFKPERSHHCSACNRCVLNMDHHCPWLNNCIGFYNRKFFLLLLFYVVVAKAEIFIYYLPIWIEHIIIIFDSKFVASVDHYLTFVVYLMNAGMFVVVAMFFRFHLTLVRDNTTTIEQMDKKRSPETKSDAVNYDMGVYYNFIQIFGKNPWLWPFPVFLKSGRPVGDGVVWPQKPLNAQRYEIDMNIRNVSAQKDPSEQGSGTRDKASPLVADAQTPSNERSNVPFASANSQRQKYQPPTFQGQTYNAPMTSGQGQPMMGGYRPEERTNDLRPNGFGMSGNLPSDRSMQFQNGQMGNISSGPFDQHGGFDQTQRMDGFGRDQAPIRTGPMHQ